MRFYVARRRKGEISTDLGRGGQQEVAVLAKVGGGVVKNVYILSMFCWGEE